jgi:hypothetical protein
MAAVTLRDLFAELDGRTFEDRQEFEQEVIDVFNKHVAELPIGYSYKDAIEGARLSDWLITDNGQGVPVEVREPAALAQ